MDLIPWSSLLGGMLLGITAIMFLLINGKIAGISGITAGIFTRKNQDLAWRVAFISGLIIAGIIAAKTGIVSENSQTSINPFIAIAAGLLVGIGTKIGNGCTSGHGICGIGRLSIRSIVATVIFMISAIATVFIRLHLFSA